MQIVFTRIYLDWGTGENFAKLEVLFVIWLMGYLVNLLNIWLAAGCEAQQAGRPGSEQDVKERFFTFAKALANGPPSTGRRRAILNGSGHLHPDQQVLTTPKYTYKCECVKWEFKQGGETKGQAA